MPGIRLVTSLSPRLVLDTAHQVARNLDFTARPVSEKELAVQRGNFAASLFLGALFPYCNFRIRVDRLALGQTEIAIERNHPWWSGPTGIGRIKEYARELADALEQSILQRRGEVLSRDVF
jgi:hypothetical protein